MFLLFSCNKNKFKSLTKIENKKIELLQDTITFDYYLKYKQKNIKIESFLKNETAAPGLIKMFDLNSKSFILKYLNKDYYVYTFNLILNDKIVVYNFHEMINLDSKIEPEFKINDTTTILITKNINISAIDFYSNKTIFKNLNSKKTYTNYLIRNNKWLLKAKTKEQRWVMNYIE